MKSSGDCKPEDTRPLNITNTSNRLLANAVRLRIEPILERWITPMQRGFLSGRSMLANVVDVDEQMMISALEDNDPAAIFFDFEDASPSFLYMNFYSWSLDKSAFQSPSWLSSPAFMQVISAHVSLGARFPGFHLLSGIRQG